jgi:ribosomal protein L25 (general stress protein Ctc)
MLQVYKRDLNQKNKDIRKSGYIIGLISGPNLESDIPIQIPKTPFLRFAENSNNNLNVDLLLDGKVKKCLITEIQSQPAFEGYLHINFKCID